MSDIQDITSEPGDVTIEGGVMQVVFHRRYAKAVEKVWAAVTVPERLADWLAVAEYEPKVGGVMRLHWTGPDSRMEGRVVAYDPPRTFAFTWPLGGRDTVVRFDLAPVDGGCELTLTHSNLDPQASGGVRAGWHSHLEGISDAIEGRATSWPVIIARRDAANPLYPKL